MGFFAELKRRHVVKVAIVYATVGFAVLQGAVLLLPRMDVPDSTLNLLIAIVVVGFPVALVLAWALEVSPEGVRRTADPVTEAPASAPVPVPESAPAARPPDERSVAILPLANLSRDPDNEFFSDGITEEILMLLAKVQSLKVISRTSVMRYKETSLPVPQIAAELGVAYVVEGSVRRSGDRVRITAQLIDGRTDRHVWAESYDRDLEDIFAIQTDVAQAIVRELRAALRPGERERLASRPTAHPGAYEAYLEARHLIPRRTQAALRQAIERLDRAVAADPEFALAWAARAEAYALLPSYSDAPAGNALDEARSSARRALELDPGLAEAHAALGLAAQAELRRDEAEREYRKALALAPGYAMAHHWYANLLVAVGRIEESLEARRRALELDPLSIPIHMGHGATLGIAERDDEAEAVYRKALELDPTHVGILSNLASLYERHGRIDEAIDARDRVARAEPQVYPPDLVAETRAGWEADGARGFWTAKAAGIQRRGLQRPGIVFESAEAFAQIGRLDEAFAILERLIDSRHPVIENIWVEPLLEPLRPDPRYAKLRERAGAAPAAERTGS